MSLNNTQFLRKILLIFSIFSFFYFLSLIYISYYPAVVGVGFIQILGELLTIPLMVILLCSFVISLIKIFKNENRKGFISVFCVNLITVVLLTYFTYIQ